MQRVPGPSGVSGTKANPERLSVPPQVAPPACGHPSFEGLLRRFEPSPALVFVPGPFQKLKISNSRIVTEMACPVTEPSSPDRAGALPACCTGLLPRLPAVAAVAEGLEVFEHQSQVRTHCDRNPVVGMEVSLSTAEPLPQFAKDPLGRRIAQFEATAVRDDLRFPAALDASPLVSLEAQHSQPAMVAIVAAFGWRRSLSFLLPPMRKAIRCFVHQYSAARPLAGPFGCAGHQEPGLWFRISAAIRSIRACMTSSRSLPSDARR